MQEHDFLTAFSLQHQLPNHYPSYARTWFEPLARQLNSYHDRLERQVIIAINGCQGSGKSVLGALLQGYLVHHFGKNCLVFSLDDFYLTKQERQILAVNTHPLLATRGVPGTHDIDLLRTQLQLLKNKQVARIPQFSKAADDRLAPSAWLTVDQPPDIIIIEGWCMGTQPQTEKALRPPVNSLEALKDPNGHWRRYVNNQLRGDYARLFQQMDIWIMLQAPDFNCVYQWRTEQEQKLEQTLTTDTDRSGLMTPEQITHFIQYYQRLTEHTLNHLPEQVNFLYLLDEDRHIKTLTQPQQVIV